MESRTCEFCSKSFKNGNSYRVHKSRYHRGETATEKRNHEDTIDKVQENETPTIKENATSETTSDNMEATEEESGFGWLWRLGGIAVAITLLFFFGRYGGGRQ